MRMPRFTQVSETRLSASFRDPAGRLFELDGRIFRLITQVQAPAILPFLATKVAKNFISRGLLVRTDLLSDAEATELKASPEVEAWFMESPASFAVEHERIPFPSYPFEWPPPMLHDAGRLTLELAEEVVRDGFGLKDATPYNVLFRGPRPVFIDVLSFERRDPLDPVWLPYAQFVRTFLLPLLINREFGIPLNQILLARRDGLEPEEVYRMCGTLRRLRPPFLTLVSIPSWLAARHDSDDRSIYRQRRLHDPEKAKFILLSVLKGLRRQMSKVAPRSEVKSKWASYMTSDNNYSQEHFQAKQRFIEEALEEFRPAKVLDVGCNMGHFSLLAARHGSSVTAVDSDAEVVSHVWRMAREESLDVLPLVVDITRPSPSVGWRNCECKSFLDRARGSFDAVFMLALIHHLLVTERIPLPAILELAAELTRDLLVIEYVAPEDTMFRRLTRGREALHADLTREKFEAACHPYFECLRSQHLDQTSRWLYLLRKRQAP